MIGKVQRKALCAPLCLTLCDPMDCSPPGSSVHWIFQARVLEWGAIAFSRRRARLPISVFLGFPCGSAGKVSACNVADLSLIPGLARSPEEGKGYSLQYSSLKNIVHGVAKSQTQLSNSHFHFQSKKKDL